MISTSSARIFGLRALRDAKPADHVAWAEGSLLAGNNTLNLRMLASLSGEESHWEVEAHFTLALRELGVAEPSQADALRGFAIELAQALASGVQPVDDMVGELARIGWKLAKSPYDRWSNLELGLLDARAGHEPDYVGAPTNENVEGMIRAEAVRFLRDLGEMGDSPR